jgi:hypothetical protein
MVLGRAHIKVLHMTTGTIRGQTTYILAYARSLTDTMVGLVCSIKEP